MAKEKKHHVIITGTGRSGTTFLVKILTKLGLDTGFEKDFTKNGEKAYFEECNAGLEYQGLGGNLPYIIKNPKLMWQLPELLKNNNSVVIDHVILPVRDIHAASESRRENVRKSSENIDPRAVLGGLEGVNDPQMQEDFFLEKYYDFSLFLSTYNIPITLIQYPRLVSDSEYLYNKLGSIFKNINKNEFNNAFNEILDLSLVHTYNNNDIFSSDIYDDSYNILSGKVNNSKGQLGELKTKLFYTGDQINKINAEIKDIVKSNKNELEQINISLINNQNQLMKIIKEKDIKLEEQFDEKEKLNKLLAEKEILIKKQNNEKEELNRFIAEKDSQIQKQIAENNDLSSRLTDREIFIKEQEKILQQKDAMIEHFIKEKEKLDILITERNEYINLIFSTYSWRITKPLRFISSLIRAIKRETKKLIKRTAKGIYYYFPLPRKYKVSLKNKFYRHAKFFMKNTEMYKIWDATFNKNLLVDTKIEGDTHNNVCEVAEIINDGEHHLLNLCQDIIGEHDEKSIYYKEFTKNDFDISKNDIKLIAFYLPQFHPIDENDEWWGKGFTEWTNVAKALPQFKGHYQPHLPGELNFYDLRILEVMERQIELAKTYGIYGFSFYYYWFDGRRILEKPLDQFLESNLNFPFCLCWANENWTRSWDGEEKEILLEQDYKDLKQFIIDIEKYFVDSRYIKIDNKPLLIIYRPAIIPNLKKVVSEWRTYCKDKGIGDLYIIGVYVKSWGFSNHEKYGLDGMLEFPPHSMYESGVELMNDKVIKINKNFKGSVFDYKEFVENRKYLSKNIKELFKGITPSWDNTARRGQAATIYHGSTPELYKKWLIDIINYTKKLFTKEKQIVFINAWNEWAEGAHLEPDRKYGYAYLEATREAIIETSAQNNNRKILVVGHDAFQHGAQILLLNIVKFLNNRFKYKVYVILKNSGELLEEYKKVSEVYLLTKDNSEREIKGIIHKIKNEGVEHAITNTVITGDIVKYIKEENMQVISLIHELSGVIKQYGAINNVKDIINYSDRIIFPSEYVKNDIEKIIPIKEDKSIVCPQGLYFKNKFKENKDKAKRILREKLELPIGSKIILGIGYADKRKGIDIFIKMSNKFKNDLGIYFLWIGKKDINFWEKDNLEEEIKNSKNFIWLDYQEDLSLYYSGVDIYLLTSREDPFPSVVLDALDAGLPVIGFEDAGGFSDIVNDNTGKIVPFLDLELMEQACRELIYNDKLIYELGENGRKAVIKNFSFKDYMYKLLNFLTLKEEKVSVIIPNYNYARYLNERIKSVITQNYPVYEVIILDDHSTDESEKVIYGLTPKYEEVTDFIVIINEKNSGSVFSQWYKGLNIASGDYVWIAEADDLSKEDFLSTVINGFKDNVILSYCQSIQIDSKGNVLAEDYKYYTNDINKEKWEKNYINNGINEIEKALVIKNTIPNVSAVIFRNTELLKQSIKEAKKFKIAGDWYVYVNILTKGDISYISKSLNMHRRHEKGCTISGDSSNLYNEIVQMQNYIISNYDIESDILVNVEKYQNELIEQFNLSIKI